VGINFLGFGENPRKLIPLWYARLQISKLL